MSTLISDRPIAVEPPDALVMLGESTDTGEGTKPAMSRVLLIEDERPLRTAMSKMLRRGGFELTEAESIAEAQAAIAVNEFDLIITDVNLGDGNGIEFVRKIRSEGFAGYIVVITAYGTIETAVGALKQGADDFLQKPLKVEELPVQAAKWIEQHRLSRRLKLYERLERNRDDERRIVGQSAAWAATLRLADRLASVPLDARPKNEDSGVSLPVILLLGETGSGKGVLARHIHQAANSADSSAQGAPPFVHVNCSALPANLVEAELFGHEKGAFTDAREAKQGLFEMAEGGTIFLDEISEMPLELQAKLLIVVEQGRYRRVGGTRDRTVRARIIAASNLDLEKRADQGLFRRDLLYRLNAFTIRIPALRERDADILTIAETTLDSLCRRYGRATPRLSAQARSALMAYRWPGNVRELVNTMQRIAMLCDAPVIEPSDLGLPTGSTLQAGAAANGAAPMAISTAGSADTGVLPKASDVERQLIMEALKQTRGNVSRAAKLIGLTRAGMRYRVEQFGLQGYVEEVAK